MFKKTLFCWLLMIFPLFLVAQDAEDIVVPEGYLVEKIAETNKATECMGLAFDLSGNLIVGSNIFIYRIDPNGNVDVMARTRKFNFKPEVVRISSVGEYIVTCGNKISRFTSPDNFETLAEHEYIYNIRFDKSENLYAIVRDIGSNLKKIVRYNSAYDVVDIVREMGGKLSDFDFDGNNNMYVIISGNWGQNNGKIMKILAGADGVPDSGDDVQFIRSPQHGQGGLNYPLKIAIDAANNLYVNEYSYEVIDGFSVYDRYKLIKIDSQTGDTLEGIVDHLEDPRGLIYRDGFIYVSEFQRGVVSKIDLSTNSKTDFTHDYGMNLPGVIAFDSNDDLYTAGFRDEKLCRQNESGTFDQVGEGVGYVQSIVLDGDYFYMGSLDLATGNGRQILKVDPIAETAQVIGHDYSGFRSIALDSYGRLILNTLVDYDTGEYGIDIIDINTGENTPYVVGIHNKDRGIQFDTSQNLYVVEGLGDGIKKVWLGENYAFPRDIRNEPLFYDFRNEPYPPTIYFIYVNLLEEVFIPLMETGTILKGDKDGIVEVLAQGFSNPSHVTFDRFGAMYVTDPGNGIFRIVNPEWTMPAIIAMTEKLIQEIGDSGIQGIMTSQGEVMNSLGGGTTSLGGVMNSLVKKLENAVKSLENENIKSAINNINAFKNEAQAQRDKKIQVELADHWIDIAEKMVNALGMFGFK